MQLAISHPNNLRDMLSREVLNLPDNISIDRIMEQCKTTKETPRNDNPATLN